MTTDKASHPILTYTLSTPSNAHCFPPMLGAQRALIRLEPARDRRCNLSLSKDPNSRFMRAIWETIAYTFYKAYMPEISQIYIENCWHLSAVVGNYLDGISDGQQQVLSINNR